MGNNILGRALCVLIISSQILAVSIAPGVGNCMEVDTPEVTIKLHHIHDKVGENG